MISFSTALKNYLLGTGSLKAAMDGGVIRIFGGPVPASPDDAAASAVLLGVVTKDGDGVTGLTFAAPADGTMEKTSDESWSANNTSAGTASFYRFCTQADDGTGADDGVSTYRIQGTIGTNPSYDMNVPSAEMLANGQFGPVTTYNLLID